MRTTTFKIKLPIKYKENGKADYDLKKSIQMKDLYQIGWEWKNI